MGQKAKMLALVILAALVAGAIGATGVVAAQDSGKIIINGEDVTHKFVDDQTVLKGTFTADSTSVRLAEMYAKYYLRYLKSGLDVSLYYHGSSTTRISITIPVTASVS